MHPKPIDEVETDDAQSNEMLNFLTAMKLIYEHGVAHSKNNSKMHRLFAIHHIHYVVEQILRERAKDTRFEEGHLSRIGFKEIIEKLHKKMNIPDYHRLLTLNKIRNDAEHHNIIADFDEVRFHVKIVESFLRWSYSHYFGEEYDSIAYENMIYDVHIRRCMIEAKHLTEENKLTEASKKMHEALGAFKFQAFGYLADHRVRGFSFGGIDMPNLLADLGLKLLMADDIAALRLMFSIGSSFASKNGMMKVTSTVKAPIFTSKEETIERYEAILNLILTYQDKFPYELWRTGEEQEKHPSSE